MKGHIFIKTNDKLGRVAERAPDNFLHTTVKKNSTNKQTYSVQQSSSSCRSWAGQKIANILRNQKINYSTSTAPPLVPFPDKNQTIHTLFLG